MVETGVMDGILNVGSFSKMCGAYHTRNAVMIDKIATAQEGHPGAVDH